ncbi:MAG: 30S ribosome-binding factor RbfA [Pseudomonadales bacterium]|nr:30S ribosome-binding factor RbfA [Pseudomonadales bacterium]
MSAVRPFGRDLRIADFIRDEVAAIILRQIRDPRVGMVSVNEVTVSRDLSYADVYITTLDAESAEDRSEVIEVLNKAAGYFRTELAKRHSMRTTPRLRFHYDEAAERGPRMDALIDSAMRSNKNQAADDAADSQIEDDSGPAQ